MDIVKSVSGVFVLLVVLWTAGSAVELFLTTLSVGPNVAPAAVTLGLLVVVVLATVGVGARSRRWLENPRSYW